MHTPYCTDEGVVTSVSFMNLSRAGQVTVAKTYTCGALISGCLTSLALLLIHVIH